MLLVVARDTFTTLHKAVRASVVKHPLPPRMTLAKQVKELKTFQMLFKPKWLRHHHQLARLYESCSTELMKEEGVSSPPVDVLCRVIEKREPLDFFASLDKAYRIKEDFEEAKWREHVHNHMLDVRHSIQPSEVERNLNHIEERIESSENQAFFLFCYYISTTIDESTHGITQGGYFMKAYLNTIPKDKSLKAVWVRAKLFATMRQFEEPPLP